MNNKRVLIISADFFGYHQSVGNAFEELGFQVFIETYDEPVHPFKGWLRWQHKIAINKEALHIKSMERYSRYIKNVFLTIKPDLVFIFNGTMLTDGVLDFFRHYSKVILWMYDSVRKSNRSMCISHIDYVDAFFCFEQSDVDFYADMNKTAYFLPVAYDPQIYYPIDCVKDIDILFVGTIYISPKRIRLLHKVIQEFPDKRILIYGYYKPYFKNPIKWLFRDYRHIFMNRNIAPQKVNELFSRTHIALNIHNVQTFNGANPRLFEACGAGVYQVCDSNPFIESLFKNQEIGLYSTDEEMIEQLRSAFKTDNLEHAQEAYSIVRTQHTFLNRVVTMLQTIGLE